MHKVWRRREKEGKLEERGKNIFSTLIAMLGINLSFLHRYQQISTTLKR